MAPHAVLNVSLTQVLPQHINNVYPESRSLLLIKVMEINVIPNIYTSAVLASKRKQHHVALGLPPTVFGGSLYFSLHYS